MSPDVGCITAALMVGITGGIVAHKLKSGTTRTIVVVSCMVAMVALMFLWVWAVSI